MLQAIADFLGADRYSQHAVCLTNDPLLIGLYTGGDLAIWASYMVIATAMLVFKLRAITARSISFNLLVGFIYACGWTHFTKQLTIWTGIYRLDVVVVIFAAAGIGRGRSLHHLGCDR